ncbi:CxxxxCH/CxxCH domain c-type cytochrome [Geotalea uraniireducens]|uniref:Cytochrome C family protein n=1 Tax=Geotalea uraniireducens (strain Rf4) TaxID=351605 RepID=A5GCI5_GEOUR|nr:CxxxxCH/CxxCH domain-containing protein [Geotalea uraniireducens]ABQ24714.1 cytochrome C family protein [Geotalea uraniireducens Rf4]
MKTFYSAGYFRKPALFLLLSLMTIFVFAASAFALTGNKIDQCYDCHGSPGDNRPLDAVYRDMTSGAFPGNHRTHMASTATASSCVPCHNNSGFTIDHRNGKIQFAANVNTSPATGKYMKYGFQAFTSSQVSSPTLGTCATVNCHFESITPTWGSSAASTNCDTCHAAQPSTLSHPKHVTAFGGTASCIKCHPNRTTFEHATSAGNAGRNIAVTIGSYAGSNYNYLPSQSATRTAGSCSALYCHSSGQSATGGALTGGDYVTATWDSAASGACGTCHKNTAATIASGSHNKHLNAAGSAGCVDCHVGVTGDGVSYNSTRHVDTFINVTGAYSQGKASTPGNGYGTCSAAACHDNGTGTKVITPTWGNTAAACTACHALQPATGSHTKHLSTTQYTKANCASCHASAVEGSNGGTGHLDGNIDAINGYPANKTKGSAYATCNAAYCHSPGQSVTGGALTTEYATITWGGTAACGSCHNATKATIASGSHNKHLNAAGSAGCVDCHVGVTGDGVSYNSTRHVDTFINVTGAYSQGKASTPGNGYGTCSAAACHDNGTGTKVITPTWGNTAAACTACHALQPATGSHTKHLSTTQYTKANCASCHASAVEGSNGGTGHLDGNIDATNGYPANKTKGSAYATCNAAYCHSPGQSVTGGALTTEYATITWGGTAACGSCHNATKATIASGSHNKHLNAAGSAGCVDCHVGVTGDGVSYNSTRHVDTFINVTGAYSQGKASTPGNGYGTCSAAACHDNGTGTKVITPTWGNTAAACTACHALQPATGSHTKHLSTTQYTKANCASCHASAVEGSNGGTGHLDGNIDAINGYPANKTKGSAYATCNAAYCHSPGQSVTGGALTTEYATITWGGTAACGSCHNATKATIASGSHNKHLNAAGSAGCVDCHVGVTGDGVSYNSTRHVDTFINVTGAYSQGKASTPGNGYGTCSAAACHDNGTGTKAVTPTWGDTAAACTACHILQPATGSHTKHLTGLAGKFFANAVCADCHNGAVQGTSVNANHLDSNIDVYKTTAGDLGYSANKLKGSPYASCTTTYCHSNGRGGYQSQLWGATNLNCSSCHPNLTGAHGKHVKDLLTTVTFYAYTSNKSAGDDTLAGWGYKFGCANCHPTAATSHLNGSIDVQVNNVAGVGTLRSKNPVGAAVNVVVTGSNVTCTAVYCHSDGKATPTGTSPNWYATFPAGSDRCAQCHGNSPTTGAHQAHVVGIHQDNIFNGASGKLLAGTTNSSHGDATQSTTINCNICHSLTVTSARNDENLACIGCHSAKTNKASIAYLGNHVNGQVNFSFAAVAVKSRAQVRDGSFDSYSGAWGRNANSYKAGATPYDAAKKALDNTMWSAGNCSNIACHNGKTVNWNDTTVTCESCHTGL